MHSPATYASLFRLAISLHQTACPPIIVCANILPHEIHPEDGGNMALQNADTIYKTRWCHISPSTAYVVDNAQHQHLEPTMHVFELSGPGR
jgi:hypothetical protein